MRRAQILLEVFSKTPGGAIASGAKQSDLTIGLETGDCFGRNRLAMTNAFFLRGALVTAFILLSGCASSRETFDPPRTMTGQIMVVGNEPFTRLAVQVEHEKVYLIHCNDSTKQLLLSHQGRIAQLVYNEIRETNRGKELEVLSATFNSN
jgi:hypothetical protein